MASKAFVACAPGNNAQAAALFESHHAARTRRPRLAG